MATDVDVFVERINRLEIRAKCHGVTVVLSTDQARDLLTDLFALTWQLEDQLLGRDCTFCSATGLSPASSPNDCPECGGQGYI